MNEFDDIRIPDHYADPTPAAAIYNERKHPMAGEVWTDVRDRLVLVLREGRGHAMILALQEDKGDTEVYFDGHRYSTCVDMITFLTEKNFGAKQGELDSMTFDWIMDMIRGLLGVDSCAEYKELAMQLEAANRTILELEADNDMLRSTKPADQADDRPEKVKLRATLCSILNELYERKNHDYGDSFHKTWEEYGPMMLAIRLDDKLGRFKKLTRDDAQVKDESVRDTLLDLANYAIMGVMEM